MPFASSLNVGNEYDFVEEVVVEDTGAGLLLLDLAFGNDAVVRNASFVEFDVVAEEPVVDEVNEGTDPEDCGGSIRILFGSGPG